MQPVNNHTVPKCIRCMSLPLEHQRPKPNPNAPYFPRFPLQNSATIFCYEFLLRNSATKFCYEILLRVSATTFCYEFLLGYLQKRAPGRRCCNSLAALNCSSVWYVGPYLSWPLCAPGSNAGTQRLHYVFRSFGTPPAHVPGSAVAAG